MQRTLAEISLVYVIDVACRLFAYACETYMAICVRLTQTRRPLFHFYLLVDGVMDVDEDAVVDVSDDVVVELSVDRQWVSV